MGQKLSWYNFGKERFTKSGYERAAKPFSADEIEKVDLADRIVVITGANSGLGKELAKWTARCGGTVFMVCRSRERGAQAVEDIVKQGKQTARAQLFVADVGVRADVERVVREIAAAAPTGVDALVCNAGALTEERETTVDGLESMAASHLIFGGYLMWRRLLPSLAAKNGRVIVVTSGGMYLSALDPDDLNQTKEKFDGAQVYSHAKRGQVVAVAAEAAAPERATDNVTFVSVHPGWSDTPGVDKALPGFKKWVGKEFRTTWQGAQGIAWCISAPRERLSPGALYLDGVEQPFHLPGRESKTSDPNPPSQSRALMARLAELTGA